MCSEESRALWRHSHVEGTVHHIRTWNTDARALCKQFSKKSGPQCTGSTADGPKDMKTYLEMSPHYFCTLIQADLLHSSSALTWFFSRCCSICFLRRKQNWVISSSSYSFLQVTEQIFIELMPFWKDGGPRSCWPDFTTRGNKPIWRWKHLSSLSLPHICHHVLFFFCIPLEVPLPSAFLPATSFSNSSRVSAWTACRNSSIVLSASTL